MKAVVKFLKDNILLLIGVVILIFALVKQLRLFLESLLGSLKSGFDNKNEVLKNPVILDSSDSKYTDNQAKLIADRIYHSMAFYGTDEEEIFKQLNKLSNADFNHVYNVFGYRWYNTLLGTESTNVLGTKYDMIQWLKAELSSNDFDKIRIRFSSVF